MAQECHVVVKYKSMSYAICDTHGAWEYRFIYYRINHELKHLCGMSSDGVLILKLISLSYNRFDILLYPFLPLINKKK